MRLDKVCWLLLVLVGGAVSLDCRADGEMDGFIDELMGRMTLAEKVGQLNQAAIGFDVTGPRMSEGVEVKLANGQIGSVLNTFTPEAVRKLQSIAVEKSRLKIPVLFGYDVIHGHRTIFPVPLGLASSWDMAAIEKSARIAATEAAADGLNWTFSPMVDIARDPRWGRICEGAGEDSYLGGLVAEAMVKGYQGDDLGQTDTVLACVKHFGLYGAAIAGRDYNTVDMSEVQMYQDYMGPYEAAIGAGAASVMTSFNDINGVPATASKWLQTDLLRGKWGFDGFIVTDYNAISEMINHGYCENGYVAAEAAMAAGVDMDMVDECYLNNLEKLVADGKVSEGQIDVACRRILEAKYKAGLFEDPYKYVDEKLAAATMLKDEFRGAAREIARKSFVLLKNDGGVLPLKAGKKIALVGPLVKSKSDLLGSWSAAGRSEDVVSLYEGMAAKVGEDNIVFAQGSNHLDDEFMIDRLGGGTYRDKKTADEMIADAIAAAEQADVIVAAVGEQGNMSGEAKSRSDISLPGCQQRLLEALKGTGKPLVVVLMSGRPLTLEWEQSNCDAILEVWFSGVEGGNAIADVLVGDYNPGGKLTASFPRNVGQIPVYYNHKRTGRPVEPGHGTRYRSAYIDVENEPLYPFGYGLSYTKFEYSDLKLSDTVMGSYDEIEVSVMVSNVGEYDGEEVVQLYIRDMFASVTPAVKRLKGFEKIDLAAGESKVVRFRVGVDMLKFYDSELRYAAEPGAFKVYVGGNSRDCLEGEFGYE